MSISKGKTSRKLWWDFRYIWMFISTIWVFTLLLNLNSVWRERWVPLPERTPGQLGPTFEIYESPTWVKVTATVMVLAFIGIYVEAMYRMYFGRASWTSDLSPRERWMIRGPLLAIATILVLLPYSGEQRYSGVLRDHPFAGAMMFVVIAWTLTARPDRAFSAVVISTAITSAILTLAADGGVAFNISFYSLAFGFFTSGYVINQGLINELHLEQSRLRDQAVTEERFRLARDLHDTVGHSMTQITLKTELARRLLPNDPVRAADELEHIEQLSRSLSAEVRRSIAGDVTLSLDNEINRATELLQSMEIDVLIGGEHSDIPDETADVFAWCLREGVMNVIKHSGASRSEIEFSWDDQQHILKIADNGSNPVTEDHEGQGIAGMKQRVDELNGDIEFRPIDSGHLLTVRLPG